MTTLVFVLLGNNPAPTLSHFANEAVQRGVFSNLVLLTDRPESHRRFPGNVAFYDANRRHPVMNLVLQHFPERQRIAGGYWQFTLERLFALMQLSALCADGPILHVESDVLLTCTHQHLQALRANAHRTSVPRYSDSMGIASILFAPSSNKLVHDLNQLAEILESGVQTEHDFITDMQLLGSGLNAGILGELPTLPQHAWSLPSGADSHKVIFDGLAYGQYLFGQDPLHSGGMRVSGHRNEHFPFDPSGVHWESSDKLGLLPVLQFLWQGTTYELANVHVHSKECVSSPDGKSDRWNRVFAEANEAMPRMSEGPFTDEIHSQTIPFADRIRISYRSGKIRSLIRLVTEKIGLVRAPRRKR